MEIFFLITLGVFLLFFGFSALLSDYKSKTNKYFLAFIFCLIFWIFSNYFSNLLKTYNEVLFSNRLIFTSTTLLVWVLFLFASVYPTSKHTIKKKFLVASTLFTAIVAILGLTPQIVRTISIENYYSSIEFGNLIPLYLIHFSSFFLLFIVILVNKYGKAEGTEKVKLQYLIFGIVLTTLGAVMTNLFLPMFLQIFYLSNSGPTFLIIFVAFTFFSIVRHRFLGIRLIIGKIFSFILISLYTLGGYFLLIWFLSTILGGMFQSESIVTSLIIVPIYAWSSSKLNTFIIKWIEDKFVYTEFNPTETLSSFLKETNTELDIDRVSDYIVKTIKKSLNVPNIGILLFDKESKTVLYERVSNFNLNKSIDLLEVVHYWEKLGDDPVLILDEMLLASSSINKGSNSKLDLITNIMQKAKISAILPLNRKVQLNGIIIIGERKGGYPYTIEEVDFLESIISNASVAIGRSILYEQVEDFNKTLQLKVDEQTIDLQEKITQLNEARERENDLIDTMGHELRTPMTIIKDYFGLLKKYLSNLGIKGPDKKSEEKYEKYLTVIERSIKREIDLTNTLLNATKLDEGRIELIKEPLEVVELIQDGITGQEKLAKEKGLKIIINKIDDKNKDLMVLADKIRIQEVIDNLINNAVKYTEKGTITIDVESNDKFALINIQDTGIGIPKKDLDNLGEKFFRSKRNFMKIGKESSLVRPGGTGLGLFVTFGIVKEHGGKIDVKSEVGKGSTFSVSLPLVTSIQMNENPGLKKSKSLMLKKEDFMKRPSAQNTST